MKILILAGFLGAGKTTVLMELAGYLVRRGEQVVILENEISSAGVDNQLLKSKGFQVRNIFAGCVCCTSTGALCQDVRKIEQEYNPHWLIIEATGMAYPDSIRDNLKDELAMESSILTLVDAKRWKRVLNGLRQFVISQLRGASVVLVTKIDTVPETTVSEVIESVREFTGPIPIHPICALEPQRQVFWETLIGEI